MRKLIIATIFGLGVYFLLTLPHLLSLFTMDLNTGQYFGFIYPLWLIMIISFISGFIGSIIAKFGK